MTNPLPKLDTVEVKVKIINININKQKDITIKEILGIVDKSNLTSKLYYY